MITKSSLVTRDADLLQDIGRTYAAVSFTITTADDEMARKLELMHRYLPSVLRR